MTTHQGVWRSPAEETIGLYPGLVVHDGRVTGSITIGQSRLPIWAVITDMVYGGWNGLRSEWIDDNAADWTAHEMAEFLYRLLDVRGEFARLLLMLADAERREHNRTSDALSDIDEGTPPMETELPLPWWREPETKSAIADQLRSCLTVLEGEPS